MNSDKYLDRIIALENQVATLKDIVRQLLWRPASGFDANKIGRLQEQLNRAKEN